MKHLAILKHVAILIVMFSGGAWADDCKPIVEALAKQANTSFRVVYHGTEWDKNGQCRSYAGLSQHNASQPSYFPYVGADAFPKVSACRALGATTIRGASTEHFYAAVEVDVSEKLFSEFWISPDTGLVLKRSEVRPDKTTVIEYEYDKLGNIF